MNHASSNYCNDIKELPSVIYSSNNHEYHVYIPSFEEFILLMKRGPQIIYPKDIGTFEGSVVVSFGPK